MLRFSDITSSLQTLLTDSVPLKALGVMSTRVLRGDYVNQDPNMTPWIGIYRTAMNYQPGAIGYGCGYEWDAKPKLRVLVQTAHSRSGADCEDRLEQLVDEVIASMLYVPSWDVTGATLRKSASLTEDPSGQSMAFSDDGASLYVFNSSPVVVHQYDLDTPWDVDGMTYSGKLFAPGNLGARGICFSPDGGRMYLSDSSTRNVYQYVLTTAWDVSTATLSGSFYTGADSLGSIDISRDGATLFAYKTPGSVEYVYSYALSTAWDVSTAVFVTSVQVTDSYLAVKNIKFRADGLKFWINTAALVRPFTLTTAWDISTATYDGAYFVPASSPVAIEVSHDGRRFYISETTGDTVKQYDMATSKWSAVDNINEINIEYSYKDADTASIYFQWAMITISAELTAG